MTRFGRGFTLIELLLAMTMAAMLALTLYSCMTTAFRARRIVTEQTQAPRQAAIALDLIAADLRAALRPESPMSSTFLGQAAKTGELLSFSLGRSDGMSSYVRLGLQTDGSVTSIVRQEESGALSPSMTQSAAKVLLRNVQTVTLRYFDGIDWVDSWDSEQYEKKMPSAVEVMIEMSLPDPAAANRNYRMTRIIAIPQSSLVAEAAKEEEPV